MSSGLQYIPEPDSNLVLLSEYSSYNTSLPATIKVPNNFGSEKVLIIDGYASQDRFIIDLINDANESPLKVTIDTDNQELTISSDIEVGLLMNQS